MNGKTPGERFARIETLLEILPKIEADIKAIRADLDADKADLAGLKNRGIGVLIGTAIAASALGATAGSFWRWLVGLFA